MGLKKKLGNCGGGAQCTFFAIDNLEADGWSARSEWEDQGIGKKLSPTARLACMKNIQGDNVGGGDSPVLRGAQTKTYLMHSSFEFSSVPPTLCAFKCDFSVPKPWTTSFVAVDLSLQPHGGDARQLLSPLSSLTSVESPSYHNGEGLNVLIIIPEHGGHGYLF